MKLNLLGSLKSELARSVSDHTSRIERKKKLLNASEHCSNSSISSSFLVYDIQGLNIKRIWEEVLGNEVTSDGKNVWIDLSTAVAQRREVQRNNALDKKGNNNDIMYDNVCFRIIPYVHAT